MEYRFKNIVGNFVKKEGEVIATTEEDKVFKFQTFNAFEQFGDLMKASDFKKDFDEIQHQFDLMVKVQYAYRNKFGSFKNFDYKKTVKVISENFDNIKNMENDESVNFVLKNI
jgi:hypothetical protein